MLSVALAQECAPLEPPPERLAVAWVSRVRQTVGAGAWLPVVPAAELRAFVKREKAGPGRVLQALGMRKKAKDPRRRYKVTIFDLGSTSLCRPIDGTEEGFVIDGVTACGRLDHTTNTYAGCGFTTDLADGGRGLDLYRVRWRDAAANGFCVLPLERYLAE